ncbi:MAG TPA: phage holin family protein [Candidatus Saccharimonadales bacterium]|nr:phage holin family protein [Candidatus Saccharimonadales bacterium]
MTHKSLKHKKLYDFLTRWLVCSLGLWVAANFLSSSISYDSRFRVIIIAGLVLAIINVVIKPILVIFSLPAILLTLGLFMIIINGLTVFIASKLYHPLHITNFWAAVFAGMVIGLVNYLVSAILEDFAK